MTRPKKPPWEQGGFFHAAISLPAVPTGTRDTAPAFLGIFLGRGDSHRVPGYSRRTLPGTFESRRRRSHEGVGMAVGGTGAARPMARARALGFALLVGTMSLAGVA